MAETGFCLYYFEYLGGLMIFAHAKIINELLLSLGLRKVLSSVERKIGLVLHYLRRTPPRFTQLEVVLNKG